MKKMKHFKDKLLYGKPAQNQIPTLEARSNNLFLVSTYAPQKCTKFHPDPLGLFG